MNTSAQFCPVDTGVANERVLRILAAFVVALTALSLFIVEPWIMLFLAVDFAVRAFAFPKLSVLRLLSEKISNLLGQEPRPVNAGPKRFAAGLGMIFSLIIGALLFTDYYFLTALTGGMLVACAVLESVAGYCVGCKIYMLQVQLKSRAFF
jgi:predicted secreted protein